MDHITKARSANYRTIFMGIILAAVALLFFASTAHASNHCTDYDSTGDGNLDATVCIENLSASPSSLSSGDTTDIGWDITYYSSGGGETEVECNVFGDPDLADRSDIFPPYFEGPVSIDYADFASFPTDVEVRCEAADDADGPETNPDNYDDMYSIVTVSESNQAPVAEDDPKQTSDPVEYCASTGTAAVVDVMANDYDPDGDQIEINSYTQPSNGTVTLDDRGTATTTDDRLSYYPSATGTDSFTYTVNDIVSGTSKTSGSATVRFNVTEDSCGTIGLSADPDDMPAKDNYGTTTISWSYDGVNSCETQDGTSAWRNVDPMATANCEPGEDASCYGSDSTEIYDLENDTTFTLACDTALDGDSTIDTSKSTTVTVTDYTACPFVEGSGDDEYDDVVIINEHVRADTSPYTTSEYPKSLSPGTYEVAMWGFDDARGTDYSRSAQNQQYEKYYVQFENSDESYEVNSSSTKDLPDDTQLGTTTFYTTADITESVTEFKGAHHGTKVGGYSSANSLDVGCVGIDSSITYPSTTLSANPDSIDYSGSTTLDWSFTDVSKGTTSSDTGNSQWTNTDAVSSDLNCDPHCSGSSSQTISDLTQDTTFYLDFQDAYGRTATSSVWVDVDDKPVSLSADPNSVEPDGSTTLSWKAEGMDSCTASSDPTNSQWDSTTSVSIGSGSKTITDMSSTTDFTITCEDTSEGATFTDSVNVEVLDFELVVEPKEVWGVQLPGSITTQSNVSVDATKSFNGVVKLSAEFVEGDIGASIQWVDDNGNVKENDKTNLNKFEYSSGYWLQTQLGANVAAGKSLIRVTATNKNSSSSDSEIIQMHVRSIGEQ